MDGIIYKIQCTIGHGMFECKIYMNGPFIIDDRYFSKDYCGVNFLSSLNEVKWHITKESFLSLVYKNY